MTAQRDWVNAHARDNGWVAVPRFDRPDRDHLPAREVDYICRPYIVTVYYTYAGEIKDAILWSDATQPGTTLAMYHRGTQKPDRLVTSWFDWYSLGGREKRSMTFS